MAATSTIRETLKLRLVLIEPATHAVLALDTVEGYRLPRVRIAQWTRPAYELNRVVQATWGLRVLILDFIWTAERSTSCVVAELLGRELTNPHFKAIRVDQLPRSEISGREHSALLLMLNGEHAGAFSRVGWIDEAAAWVESATGNRLSSKYDIQQWNAGGAFALLRFRTEDGCGYWFKATGVPNEHEYALTVCLSELCPSCLPPLVAVKKEWNAWLTEEFGAPLPDVPTGDALMSAGTTFTYLQLQTADCIDLLLATGAFDQRLPVLRNHIDAITAFLIDAMERQSSTKVEPLRRERLLELAEILRDACFRMEALGIPDTLIHNDLNPGNILYDGTRCVFTDWSEATAGSPFLSCERLCRLNPNHREQICMIYRRSWLQQLTATSIDEAFALMPLVATYAYLYGRGQWLSEQVSSSQFEGYARSLARHMDRAAQTSALLEVLCW